MCWLNLLLFFQFLAYMAPEVFTRNMSEGHGRAADIWSVGCVVVEMASGKVLFILIFIFIVIFKLILFYSDLGCSMTQIFK